MTNGKEIKLEFDYCGLCPYLGQKIFFDNHELKGDPKTIIYCKEYHGIAMIGDVVRELTHEEWETIPDWCPLLPLKEKRSVAKSG